MTRKKLEVPDKMVEKLDVLFAEMPPADMAILSMGFFAGWHKYTPLTALVQAGGQAVAGVDSLVQRAEKGDIAAGVQAGLLAGGGGLGIGLGAMYAAFSGTFNAIAGNPSIPEAERQDILAGLNAKLALACIGAIESYAITRPGTVAAIGEIVKGIGEIVPG